MKFLLEVDLDSDDLHGLDAHRIARLLTEVASNVKKQDCQLKLGDNGRIRDVNGNTVGFWKIEGEY